MGEFINVLVSKGKSNLIPEKDNLYGQFVGEWDFEWVDNQEMCIRDRFTKYTNRIISLCI